MNKMELQSEIDNVTLELRSLMDSVKDTSKEVNADEVRAKKAELEEKRSKLIKEMAECDRPAETEEKEERSGWKALASGLQKRATTTINGTGGVNVVKELAKAIVKRYDIVNGAKFFYGPNAATNIPVWGNGVTAVFHAEGGSGTAPANQLSLTQVTPAEAFATLPISKMALDLAGANIESELPEIFANAFGGLMADGMINGKTGYMDGLFQAYSGTDLPTYWDKAISVANLGGLARELQAKNYENPVIIMSPTVYAAFLADTSTDETTKIYKESLIRDKQIENVPVILTAYAPTSVASDAIAAVGCDLSNYAIGLAGQVDIVPKQTAGSSVVTFDASSYFAGKPVILGDVIQYTVA